MRKKTCPLCVAGVTRPHNLLSRPDRDEFFFPYALFEMALNVLDPFVTYADFKNFMWGER